MRGLLNWVHGGGKTHPECEYAKPWADYKGTLRQTLQCRHKFVALSPYCGCNEHSFFKLLLLWLPSADGLRPGHMSQRNAFPFDCFCRSTFSQQQKQKEDTKQHSSLTGQYGEACILPVVWTRSGGTLIRTVHPGARASVSWTVKWS